jgi:nicotinamide mononucleotide (NMN) deamidase PncC
MGHVSGECFLRLVFGTVDEADADWSSPISGMDGSEALVD